MNNNTVKTIRFTDCDMAFAIPGQNNIIDCIRPDTGRSWHYDEDLEHIRLRYPGAEVVCIREFFAAVHRRENQPVTWEETTKEKYWEMLEILPPLMMRNGGFMVSEACDHWGPNNSTRYQGYVERHGKYFASSRPVTCEEMAAKLNE